MTIKVNTGAGEVAVNTSRIEKFMRAESRDEALKMGAWDKFKDLFRSGDARKSVQIARIFDSIVGDQANEISPVDTASRFKRLRDMASDASKSQFTISSEKDEKGGTWGFSLNIGDTCIHQRQPMLDTYAESFESFTNFQKYFEGVDTIVAPPEGSTNLSSSLKGVIHVMSGPESSDVRVLQSLLHVREAVRPRVDTKDPSEQRAILIAKNYEPEAADRLIGLSNADPVGLGLILSFDPDPVGDKFVGALEAEITTCIDSIPRHQLLSIHDFYKANPVFANELYQAGTLAISNATDKLGIDSTDDPLLAGVAAKAALWNDLGMISKLLFNAVEQALDQDIYRSYATNASSWRVETAVQTPPHTAKLIEGFLAGSRDLSVLLGQAQGAPSEPAASA